MKNGLLKHTHQTARRFEKFNSRQQHAARNVAANVRSRKRKPLQPTTRSKKFNSKSRNFGKIKHPEHIPFMSVCAVGETLPIELSKSHCCFLCQHELTNLILPALRNNTSTSKKHASSTADCATANRFQSFREMQNTHHTQKMEKYFFKDSVQKANTLHASVIEECTFRPIYARKRHN